MQLTGPEHGTSSEGGVNDGYGWRSEEVRLPEELVITSVTNTQVVVLADEGEQALILPLNQQQAPGGVLQRRSSVPPARRRGGTRVGGRSDGGGRVREMAGVIQDAGSASQANAIDVETIAFDMYCECVRSPPSLPRASPFSTFRRSSLGSPQPSGMGLTC
jgi:hypothetical protein